MGARDYAVVVGITRYPKLGNLDGPEHDARDFEAWLRSPTGGDVPAGNIELIVSSKYQPAANPFDEPPTIREVWRAFIRHYDRAAGSGKAGDRLYVYMAGHGFAPSLEEAALLMANAARGLSVEHIPGRVYANAFRTAKFFDEVVLFMDCCRERHVGAAGVNPPPFDPISSSELARHCYGFATEWSRAAREQPIGPNGQIRGLFTVALLAGLRGGAERDANGFVTASALERFVFNFLQAHPVGTGVEEAQEPVFDYTRMNKEVRFRAGPAQPFTLRVTLTPAHQSKPIELLYGAQQIPGAQRAPDLWEWALPSIGLYSLRVPGVPERVVEVIGEGGVVDVQV